MAIKSLTNSANKKGSQPNQASQSEVRMTQGTAHEELWFEDYADDEFASIPDPPSPSASRQQQQTQPQPQQQQQAQQRNTAPRPQPERRSIEEEEEEEGTTFLDRLKDKRMIIIIVVGVVIFIAIAGTIGYMSYKKLQQEEADRLLAELEAEDPPFAYTPEELMELRKRGLTGEEIEDRQWNEIPAQELINELDEARQAYLDETIKPLYDSASPEYKELEKRTWVGGPPLKWSGNREDDIPMAYVYNADYLKLPATNHQLMLRLHLKDNTYGFMYITPKRYEELPEIGNIVVNIEYVLTPDGSEIITNISEVNL